MSERPDAVPGRPWPPGFARLMSAQFLSALADQALLIVAIGRLQAQGLPGWWAPVLKLGFNASYVLLAPVAGPLADAWPKARVMAWMNGVKVLGTLGLLAGVHPVAAYALVGLGAAAYAPAKYGIVTELLPPERLVAANGWIEVSVVMAALLGLGLGGALAGPGFAAQLGPAALDVATGALLLLYAGAAVLQAGLRDTGAHYPPQPRRLLALWRDFDAARRTLWVDPQGRLSLTVTTLFWGVGATLQVAVLRWAQEALGLGLDHGAALQAAVALGVVAGAAAAGRWVPLRRAPAMLPAGVLLGGLIAAVAWCPSVAWALPLLAVSGAVGGALVVPMNALLQHRGHALLSAGRSIAVQGFAENLSVLVMLAAYAASWALPWGIRGVLAGFGALVALAMGLLWWRAARR